MKKRSKENKINRLFYVIFILLLFLFITMSFISFGKQQKNDLGSTVPIHENAKDSENESIQELPKSISSDVDLNYYRKYYKNPEIVARLEIPDVFNIFVTKASDNAYYLNHSLNKKKDILGTEFMDYRVNPLSKQINIYGHNSKTYNTHFRKLESYLDKDFYQEHPYIVLQHDGGKRLYKIFAIKEVLKDYEHMRVVTSKEDFVKHIDTLKKGSIYETDIEYNENSNIIVLQTCSYDNKEAYYIIMAIEI